MKKSILLFAIIVSLLSSCTKYVDRVIEVPTISYINEDGIAWEGFYIRHPITKVTFDAFSGFDFGTAYSATSLYDIFIQPNLNTELKTKADSAHWVYQVGVNMPLNSGMNWKQIMENLEHRGWALAPVSDAIAVFNEYTSHLSQSFGQFQCIDTVNTFKGYNGTVKVTCFSFAWGYDPDGFFMFPAYGGSGYGGGGYKFLCTLIPKK